MLPPPRPPNSVRFSDLGFGSPVSNLSWSRREPIPNLHRIEIEEPERDWRAQAIDCTIDADVLRGVPACNGASP